MVGEDGEGDFWEELKGGGFCFGRFESEIGVLGIPECLVLFLFIDGGMVGGMQI